MFTRKFLFDAGERVIWTAIQTGAGAIADYSTTGEVSWRAVGYAVLFAVAKVLVATRVGDSESARAGPGA